MNWHRRWAGTALIGVIQLAIVADALNRLESEPDLDVAWVAAFGLAILAFSVAALVLVIGYLQLIWAFASRRSRRQKRSIMEQETSSEDLSALGFDSLGLSILFGNLIADTLLFIPLVTFFGLVLDQLERLDSDEKPRSWIAVFLPLVLFFVLLVALLLVAACRTYAEERLQTRDLPMDRCCQATFSNLICGCELSESDLVIARQQRAEHLEHYTTDQEFHLLPCAYLFTPRLTANKSEIVVNYGLLLYVILCAIAALILSVQLQTNTVDLVKVLLPLMITEAVFALVALLMFVFLWNDPRATGAKAQPRFSIVQKYYTSVFVFFGGLLVLVFQILLILRVRASIDISWQLVFTPLYVLLGLIVLVGFCFGSNARAILADSQPRAASSRSHVRVIATRRELEKVPSALSSSFGANL